MNGESNRRGFLRHATLAGAALVAGAGALSATGCDGEEQRRANAELERLKAENAELQRRVEQEMQVRVDDEGNLEILDDEVKAKLRRAWEGQQSEPDFPDPPPRHPRKGIHVKFSYKVPAEAGVPPEEKKVNSLCSC